MITSSLLNNPLCIQNEVLSDYQDRLTNDIALVDANNSFSFLVESFSRIVADATNAMDAKLNGLYPIRAATTADLYNHLSDFDYVGFFSYPASFNISMMLSKDHLIEKAVKVPGTNYQMVVIPVDTIFNVGRFRLGLYYPINIKINTLTKAISASYDTTNINPLQSLATNTIQVTHNTFEGVDLIEIQFECYQFDKQVIIESVNPDIGYIKTYPYDNLFYALRVFDTTSGKPVELAYTLSDQIYDINRPTVCMKILPETKELTLSLPQIYFTSGQVGRQLQIEIYTTLGAVDASLTSIQLNDITANFAMSSPNTNMVYTDILRSLQTIILAPVDTRITGGSNSYTFTQIKDFAVYHVGASNVPITRMDLNRFFSKNGFTYMMKIDNLTDRRYYAYKKLYVDNTEVGVIYGGLTLLYTPESTNNNIIYQNNDTIVILPTILYSYSTETKKLMIADDTTNALIKNASGSQLANILNTTRYFCTPHHIMISTGDNYPSCRIFDLITNTVSNLTFIDENQYLSTQLSLITVAIKHLNGGSGGYTIRTGIQRSSDLVDVAATEMMCFLTVMSKEGFNIGVAGVYVGTLNGLDIYDFTLSTSYKLSDTTISITNMQATDVATPLEYFINLSGTMYISTYVKTSLYSDISQDTKIANYLTTNDGVTWLAISLQSFDYVLGSNLSDVIDPNLLTNWTNTQYQKYQVDILQRYAKDIYKTNSNGTIEYSIDPATNAVVTTKLHTAGDIVLDNLGASVIQHHAGDVVCDASGNPVSIAPTMLDFTINISAYEYGFSVVNPTFIVDLAADLSAYYSKIRNMNLSVLENTKIFFNPIVTMNIGQYRINNSTTISSSLELSFVFNCYVSQALLDDTVTHNTITTQINAIITSHLSDEIISMTVIAADIMSKLNSYISAIDSVSLNGSTTILTLMSINVNESPKLGMMLSVGTDGQLMYVPQVTLNYIALDV